MFDEIVEVLKRDSSLHCEVGPRHIRVPPVDPTGFEVRILQTGRGAYMVWFDGWHEEFDDYSEAVRCFAFGLSSHCRLKVLLKGKMRYRWTVECQKNSQWAENSTTGLLLFPFWRRTSVAYLANKANLEYTPPAQLRR